jgi:hypothetical protein
VTPLKKPDHHGGLLALSVLVTMVVVLWASHSKRSAPTVVERPKPQASVAAMTAEHPSLQPIEPNTTVELVVVGERELSRKMVATGPVSYDETRTSRVTAPVAGWLRRSPHGRTVRAGETVGVLYSLEVYAATCDLIAHVRDFRSQAALDEQRRRLYRWGMRREMVAAIEQTRQPQTTLPLIARVSGTVVAEKKLATPFVERGDDILTVSDPGSAWLYVDVPADDAALARVGMTGRVKIEGIARPVVAPIAFVSRHATDGNRTIRFDLHTAELRLPPTVQGKVELLLGTTRGPAIAETAIVRDGEHAFVYIAGTTRMEPREVTLGPSRDGWYLVTRGLAAGETIAVDAKHLAQHP